MQVKSRYLADSCQGKPAKFIGAHARVANEKLNKKSFEELKMLKTMNVTFDLGDLYDLSDGGKFEVHAEGGIPWAKKKSTKLVGTAPFSTQKLVINVDKATVTKSKFAQKKTVLMNDCTEGRLDVSLRANAVCSMLSSIAAEAAQSGNAEQ